MDPDERNHQPTEACYVLIDRAGHIERRARRRRRLQSDVEIVDPWSYEAKRGRGTLRLALVEYRILRFLAERPNQAVSHERIAAAVSTARHRVTAEMLSEYIRSLRGQLGFYSDYIQSVPYIGYRFTG
ncbi:MAG: winged helix-turn-helix transcriptional regulator [Planctomycetia bacterium]|nr:winged helix-turn-helix transcriptional regulator [Planctomycetia bacterium]